MNTATKQLIESYLSESDWRVNENANMGYSLQGLNSHLSSALTKDYWLHEIYPPVVRDAHLSGALHIHDLGSLSVYCCGWDLKDVLLKGFAGVYGKIESSPAKHFRTALGQIYNFLYTMAGEAAGAEAFSSFDTLLAPFVANDKLGYLEVKQAMQEFIFNLNVPTRVGFQTPFCNLTMDLVCPRHMQDEAVVIGGVLQEDTYGMFQAEMDMINRAFCEVMMEGDAAGRIFSFPIPTYNITKDFDWANQNLDLLWEMTAKYGIPYFSNFINSDMDPEDARSMCCRLRLDNRELNKRGGGLFGANPLTGSVGVVTINLAQAAHKAQGDTEAFFATVARLMQVAKVSLELKRAKLEEYTDMGLYPYSKFYLEGIKSRTGSYWANHFSTIGLIGMNEACLELTGRCGIADPEGQGLAAQTMQVMRQALLGIQEETGNIYNLEATPAEGTSYRLAKLDKKNFPGIVTAGTDEVPYYTNSTQLPVGATTDIFDALDHQDPLQVLYTGGTVFHGFIGERIADPLVARDLVRHVASHYKLPYFTITPTFSVCPVHKYISGEHFECPSCGERTEVYSRVVGFHRPVASWNVGKKEEFAARTEFVVAEVPAGE